MHGRERGWEPGDRAKAKTSLDRDCISSLQSPVSANHMGSSVIFGLRLQKKEKEKNPIERDCKSFGQNVLRLLKSQPKPHLHTPIPTSRLGSKSSEWPQQPLAEENFCSECSGIGIGRVLKL